MRRKRGKEGRKDGRVEEKMRKREIKKLLEEEKKKLRKIP